MSNVLNFKTKTIFEIKNKAEEKRAEILIYDFIGKDWFGDGVDAKKISTALAEIPKNVETIDVRINSPGGSVFEGYAIYNRLKQYKNATVNVYIDGMAASIASVIALAGDNIYMAETAEYMIHKPMVWTGGNAFEHQKSIERLDAIEDQIINVYKKKTGRDRAELQVYVDQETYFTAQEAKDLGFVDEIIEIEDEFKVAACATMDAMEQKMGSHSWVKRPAAMKTMKQRSNEEIDNTLKEIDDFLARN